VPEKGIHVLLEAMREVVDSAPDAVLLMLGSFCGQPPSPSWLLRRDEEQRTFEEMRDGYEEQMRAAASDLGDRVRFLGGVPHYDLPAYYALADVFVHPAVWNEPFGMVLTEAMASGLPVVSTRAGGIPEIVVDRETGRLVSPGEVEGLAEALVELVQDEALRKEMGKRGRQRLMDRFSWDHTARALERVIEGLQ
jgi:spore coat protein SA